MARSERGSDEVRPFKDEDAEENFLKWFWNGTNGNDLIKKLNAYAQNHDMEDRIRREKESPVVYAVVLNNDGIFKQSEENDESQQLKLCKVGFTHRSIKRGQGNRMEQVEQQITSNFGKDGAKASTLFALRIGAVDTKSFHETETRIRQRVGKPVSKDKAKEHKLAVPTEWVLTTQEHINDIKNKIEKKKKVVSESGEGDVIDIFKDIKETPDIPERYKTKWLG